MRRRRGVTHATQEATGRKRPPRWVAEHVSPRFTSPADGPPDVRREIQPPSSLFWTPAPLLKYRVLEDL
jgi:hypothetical protein